MTKLLYHPAIVATGVTLVGAGFCGVLRATGEQRVWPVILATSLVVMLYLATSALIHQWKND